ncbi:hypothetical protein ACLK10_07285 [Escherichia coli]
MIKSKIVLLSALVSCALISGCKEENKTNVSIEFMHSSVEQERQAVISKLIARFEKENPGITVKQVPVKKMPITLKSLLFHVAVRCRK